MTKQYFPLKGENKSKENVSDKIRNYKQLRKKIIHNKLERKVKNKELMIKKYIFLKILIIKMK